MSSSQMQIDLTETLRLFANAVSFNRWMFEQFDFFCRGEILEIGSGIGNLSHFLIEAFGSVTLSDVEPQYCELLKERFSSRSSFRGVYPIDLASPDIGEGHPQLEGRFDTVILLNVVEHIADHELAISNCAKLLRPGGRLVLLVPAYQGLYNSLDVGLGHCRRYTSKRLAALVRAAGLEVSRTGYFNTAGLPGWWFAGSVLRMKTLGAGVLSVYDAFVPAFKLLDRAVRNRVGLSVITLACKPGG